MNAAQRLACAALGRLDPRLKPVLKIMTPTRTPRGRGQPYEALISAIAHQQLHGNAAQAILKRLTHLGAGAYPTPAQMLKLKPSQLRACGLSAAKSLAMRDLAAHARAGRVPTRQVLRRWSDERIIEQLTQIRGIGRWTVEMLLIFTLNRPDVLPVDDYGVREGYRLMTGMAAQPKPAALRAIGARWQGHRSYMALILWDIADFYKQHKTLPFPSVVQSFVKIANTS
jgi:DNA-3-methyladenine glycosylase II